MGWKRLIGPLAGHIASDVVKICAAALPHKRRGGKRGDHGIGLAYRECAALQDFPRGFVWKRGSVRDRFQMIGNAVPPPLFEAVVGNLNDLW